MFFYYDKDTVYGARTDGDKKEYLLKINLSENTVEKISKHIRRKRLTRHWLMDTQEHPISNFWMKIIF